MAKVLRCRDLGMNCSKEIRAEDEEALLKLAAEHAEKDHGIGPSASRVHSCHGQGSDQDRTLEPFQPFVPARRYSTADSSTRRTRSGVGAKRPAMKERKC